MFKDKIILILGGTGDIGSTIADAFKKQKGTVCCHGTTSKKYQADAADTPKIKDMVKKIISEFGKIDILVNSVSASIKVESFEKKEWKDFLNHINIQLKSMVEVTGLALPSMKKQRSGKIINILSSCVIGDPPVSLSDYITAKYAALGLTKSLAKELAKYNITVNAVSPGLIKNKFTKHLPEKLIEIITAQTPRGQLVTEKDVANAVLFLASEENGFITGENIVISGGNPIP